MGQFDPLFVTTMSHSAVRIGDIAPDFESDSSNGAFKLHEYFGDGWGILFSHPRDFTPVCTTEVGTLAKYDNKGEFSKRNCKVAVVSVDTAEDHKKWINDINETQNTEVKFPIVADPDRKISIAYGMLDQTEADEKGMPLTVRAVYVIDPSKKIRLIIIYPASCGRNFDEVVRVLDSLQLTDSKKVTTPANWTNGCKVIVSPKVNDEEAKELFGEFETLKPYLRMTDQPK